MKLNFYLVQTRLVHSDYIVAKSANDAIDKIRKEEVYNIGYGSVRVLDDIISCRELNDEEVDELYKRHHEGDKR